MSDLNWHSTFVYYCESKVVPVLKHHGVEVKLHSYYIRDLCGVLFILNGVCKVLNASRFALYFRSETEVCNKANSPRGCSWNKGSVQGENAEVRKGRAKNALTSTRVGMKFHPTLGPLSEFRARQALIAPYTAVKYKSFDNRKSASSFGFVVGLQVQSRDSR